MAAGLDHLDLLTLRERLAVVPPDAIAALATSDDAQDLSRGPPVAAAVLVPIMHGEQPGVLLTKRAATLKSHAGQVAFPGGRVERTDASVEAGTTTTADPVAAESSPGGSVEATEGPDGEARRRRRRRGGRGRGSGSAATATENGEGGSAPATAAGSDNASAAASSGAAPASAAPAGAAPSGDSAATGGAVTSNPFSEGTA